MTRLPPRLTLIAALLLTAPAWADQIAATSRITAVTIYPMGAEVTREVTFTATAGAHDLVITDLPIDTETTYLRLASPDTDLGAFALRTDRLPPSEAPESEATKAAKAKVKEAETALNAAQSALASVNARIEAQNAAIALLSGLKLDAAGQSAESLTAISDMVAAKVLAAREAAIAAGADLPAATEALAKAQEALTAAQEAEAALAQGAEDRAALTVAVTAKGGEGHVTVKHFVSDTSWRPVYDLRLDRKAGTVTLDRGLLVTQYSGEDWTGVDLTLSTAQPGQQAQASNLWPELRQVYDPAELAKQSDATMDEEAMAGAIMEAVAPAVEARSMMSAGIQFQGDTVTYHYPVPVDLANGVEDLRLALDSQSLPADILALAVPRYDQTAFLQAEITNSGADILLPGTAFLYRDGMLTGQTDLASLAPGDKTKLGFGAIPGLKLTREMPETMTGDRGVFTTSTERQEKAVLKIENLTEEAWKVRLMDQVPYSEQEELKVTYEANPAATEENPEGQRGLLAWDFDLGAKETKEIALTTTLSWPEGKELQ
ncbi:DUF4139 domain-containing protein [Stagnihabitans tardus]|uniref:Mucoidy inhibitor MuiA family protein n=1 Tax=Stagnihabitans tardus TaxID=2699202 RepID=A0AAE5BUN9_9RHOB|nr:DUF4139 domain-containing protein [Stagnihabitans tardus]NBZ88101.1 mucoidy inhibitor MuiA family protein [Stagnihabitans tardus]